jgi:hypothetical protein
LTIIHIGEGRHIRLGEGALRKLPRSKDEYLPRRIKNVMSEPTPDQIVQTPHPTTQGKKHWTHAKALEIPGYREFWLYKQETLGKYRDAGRRVGEGPGIRRKRAGYQWGHAKRKARLDMEKIMSAFPDTETHAAEALEAALTVMRGPQNQTTKLAAAKLVLDFTKAKPVSKSEVTVNAAEAWLASLGTDDSDT